MAKMTKAQARKRLKEARQKVIAVQNVMMGSDHLTPKQYQDCMNIIRELSKLINSPQLK